MFHLFVVFHCSASKVIIAYLEKNYEDLENPDKPFKFFSQACPIQPDSHSCGWRTIANAWRFIESKYISPSISVRSFSFPLVLFIFILIYLTHVFFSYGQLHDYPESWIEWIREWSISLLLEKAICPYDPESPVKGEKKALSTKKSKKNLAHPKKKGLPVYSPLKFVMRSPKPSKKGKSPISRRSPKTPKSPKSPRSPKSSKRDKSEDPEEFAKNAKRPRTAKKHIYFGSDDDEDAENVEAQEKASQDDPIKNPSPVRESEEPPKDADDPHEGSDPIEGVSGD